MKLTYRIDTIGDYIRKGNKTFFECVKQILTEGFTDIPTHLRFEDETALVTKKVRGEDVYFICLNNDWVTEHADLLRSYTSQSSREYRVFLEKSGINQYKKKVDGNFDRLFPLPDQIISLEAIASEAIDTIVMNCTIADNEYIKRNRKILYDLAMEKGVEVIGYQPPRKKEHCPAPPPPMPAGIS